MGISSSQLSPLKRWLARFIQISMGLTAILSTVALFVDTPTTIVALMFGVCSVSVQLPDAFGWIFTTGPASGCAGRTRQLSCVARITERFNAQRIEAEALSSNATQYIVEFVASTREPLMKLRTADPARQEEVVNWKPRSAFTKRCLSLFDDLGYRMRHSALKCLSSILTLLLAIDSAAKWLDTKKRQGEAWAASNEKRHLQWATRVITAAGALHGEWCPGVDGGGWRLPWMDLAPACQAVGSPANHCNVSTIWFPSAERSGYGQLDVNGDVPTIALVYEPTLAASTGIRIHYRTAPPPDVAMTGETEDSSARLLEQQQPSDRKASSSDASTAALLRTRTLALRLQPLPSSPDPRALTILATIPDPELWSSNDPTSVTLGLKRIFHPSLPSPAFRAVPLKKRTFVSRFWRAVNPFAPRTVIDLEDPMRRCERVLDVQLPRRFRRLHIGSVGVHLLPRRSASAPVVGIDALAVQGIFENATDAPKGTYTDVNTDEYAHAGVAALDGLDGISELEGGSDAVFDDGVDVEMDDRDDTSSSATGESGGGNGGEEDYRYGGEQSEGSRYGYGEEGQGSHYGYGEDGGTNAGAGSGPLPGAESMLLPPLALVAAVTSTITTAAATEDFVRQEVRPAEREEAANAERLRREGHVGRKDAEARLRAACAPLPLDVDVHELEAAIRLGVETRVAAALIEDAESYLSSARSAQTTQAARREAAQKKMSELQLPGLLHNNCKQLQRAIREAIFFGVDPKVCNAASEVHSQSVRCQKRVKNARKYLIQVANDAADDAELAREAAAEAARKAAANAAAAQPSAVRTVVTSVTTVATTVATTVSSTLGQVLGMGGSTPKAAASTKAAELPVFSDDEADDDEASSSKGGGGSGGEGAKSEAVSNQSSSKDGAGTSEAAGKGKAIPEGGTTPAASDIESGLPLAAFEGTYPSPAAASPSAASPAASHPVAPTTGTGTGTAAPASAAGGADALAKDRDNDDEEEEADDYRPEALVTGAARAAAQAQFTSPRHFDGSAAERSESPYEAMATSAPAATEGSMNASGGASGAGTNGGMSERGTPSSQRASSPGADALAFAEGRSPPASLESDGTYTLRILHVDTSELRKALDEAREAMLTKVDRELVERMERRLRQATFAQQGLTMGMARFVGRLHALTAKRKRREAAAATLASAANDVEAELSRLRKVRPRKSMLEGEDGLLAGLHAALVGAREEELPVEAEEEKFANASALSEFREQMSVKLATSVEVAVECTEFFWRSSQEQMEAAKSELTAALSFSVKALVDREAEDYARGALQRLSKLLGRRGAALERLREALEALQSTTDEGLLESGAEELKLAIEAAKQASVEKAVIEEAELALNKAFSGATLMAELAACREAIEFVHKFSASEMGTAKLRSNLAILTSAVERARTFEVEPMRLAEAEKDLKEASKLMRKHDEAHELLSRWMHATEAAYNRVNNDVCKSGDAWEGNPSLKECVQRLDEAVDRAEKGKVPENIVDAARRILAPARATAKFGKSLVA